jgi:hypothetical protein
MVENPGKQGTRRACDRGQLSVSPQGIPSEKSSDYGGLAGFAPLFTDNLLFVVFGLLF